MSESTQLDRNWILTGGVTGVLASVFYPLLIFVELPDRLATLLAGALGMLIGVASLGLYRLLRLRRDTVTGQVAAIFNFSAGVVLNLMLITQMSVNGFMRGYIADAPDDAAKELLRTIWRAVDPVQLGLDVSWDFFIAAGTFLFGLAMLKHPRFGRPIGIPGMLLGALVLSFNVWTFPRPPASVGVIDWGPVTGLWYLVVSVQVLRSVRWTPGAD